MTRWNNRGRGAYRGNSSRQWRASAPLPTPELPVGKCLASLGVAEIDKLVQSQQVKETKIEDVRYVASYNWLDRGSEANIVVPGQPPRWTPSRHDAKLERDSGQYYRDKNAARFPKHPFAPAIAACLAAASSPPVLANINLVGCGSTLGNLLRFVRGEDRKCRMLVQKVGHTVFLVRRENSPTELIPDVRGHGHTFPEAFTTWDPEVKGSASHQRMITYNFGGLKLLVRYEADGYLDTKDKSVASVKRPSCGQEGPSLPDTGIPSTAVDALTAALSRGGSLSSSHVPIVGTEIHVQRAGRAPDQSQIFDIKTRGSHRRDDDHVGAELPRLWISQIPKFVLAFHNYGIFRVADVSVHDVRDRVQAWESENQTALGRLAAVLHYIIDACTTQKLGAGKLEVLIDGEGTLKVCEQREGVGDVLPVDLRHSPNLFRVPWTARPSLCCQLQLSAIKAGAGRHAWNLTVEQYQEVLQWFYANTVIYLPTAYFTKVTLLLLTARAYAIERFVARVIFTFIWGLLIAFIPLQVLKIFICNPIESFWRQDVEGTCLAQRRIFVADAALAVVSDVMILVVPIVVTMKLRMSVAKKIKIMGLLGAGGVAIAVTIWRLVKIVESQYSNNTTVSWRLLNILTILELSIGLMCSCLPSVNILWERARCSAMVGAVSYTQRRTRKKMHGFTTMAKRRAKKKAMVAPWLTATPPQGQVSTTSDFERELALFWGHDPNSTESLEDLYATQRATSLDGRREGWLDNDTLPVPATAMTGASSWTHQRSAIDSALMTVSGNMAWESIWDGQPNRRSNE
ncbi:geranylgeranyl pyrophosphate synthetase [Emericellopsis cladophorae]|uniref:Geranylgeranyl pyrophosphate synthetase n=1 Tax=Emericellopsis cladophorae TaxID=2686198 RepID=A0A9Q0BCM7_9HYPO|nr:geranylgeranyl pyrophosphate synthetase [Emericellopsis cladophorae]KAI6780502.1 geranylgeranyl pyrophosphate synthetase [Emericellopsis cladophorae]